MNICLLGLSGSGKTCYLNTACHVLSHGVMVDNHKFSITCTSRIQQIQLNKGIELLASGQWPKGDLSTVTYPFEFKIDGKSIGQFTIYDYRGGALDGVSDDDQDDINELFETFEETSCIVFLIDGDTMINALNPEDISQKHIDRNDFLKRLQARNAINYIEALLHECNERINGNVPILLCITKKDIFSDRELKAGCQLLHDLLPSVFSPHNDKIVGVTAVTLGENLQKYRDNKMTGHLWLDTKGNVHIPILFALLQEFDKDGELFKDRKVAKRMIQHLFPEDKVTFYCGDELALIV